MNKKPGYPVFLAITVLLTLSALAVILCGFIPWLKWIPLSGKSSNIRFATGIGLLFCAGAVCVTRKKLYTEPN